jgi:hypothetical protein
MVTEGVSSGSDGTLSQYRKGRFAMKESALIFTLVAVLLLPSLAFGMTSFDYPEVAPVISFVQGDVTVRGAGAIDWVAAEVGRLLTSGDTVKTGQASKAEISCATGKMRLYENTVVIVPEVINEGDKEDIRQVDLEDGTGLFKIKKRGVENGFEVHTSNIIAGVKGTLYVVLHEKKEKYSKVAVYVGAVAVTDKDRTPESLTILRRGDFLEVKDQSGFGQVEEFGPDDVWWKWGKLDSVILKPPKPPKADPEGNGHGQGEY